MGQKVNPTGFRLGISKKQNANWYAKGKDFSTNLVQDLKQSLEDTISETKYILNDLEEKLETTINDQAISDATKKIVYSVKKDITNSASEKTREIINTIDRKKAINNFEEE